MSSKSGFKETEIGLIPKDWELVNLNKICNIIMGQSPPSKFYNTEKEGLPFFQGRKDFGDKYPTVTMWCSEPKRIAEDADVLLSVRAPVGDINMAKERCCIGRGLSSVSMKNKNNEFLYYLIQYNKTRLKDIFESEGTVFGCITKKGLHDFEVAIPSENEQLKISKILSHLDKKIELNQKMNQTLEKIGQSIFRHWFIDFEFPDAEGKPYKSNGGEMVDSELGKIPKGWDIKPLDKIADFLNGLALQKFPPEGNNYLPVIKIRELKQGITDSCDKASTKIDSKYIIDDGDVLFSWSGSLEVCIWCHGKGALNQHLFKVTSSQWPKWFYYEWVKFHLMEFQRIAKEKATTMGHIKRQHLSEALTVIPPKEILEEMSKIMGPLIDKQVNNSIETINLSRIRDSLLPRLMSGKIRVTENIAADKHPSETLGALE
ncbi:MAG: restriction endonuclease subunit S [Methanobacterium sp.]